MSTKQNESSGWAGDGTPTDAQRARDTEHFNAWMDSRVNKNAQPDRCYVWNAACAYARRLAAAHGEHQGKRELAVFKLCHKCNREFEIVCDHNNSGSTSTMQNCPHCGVRNDTWIHIPKDAERHRKNTLNHDGSTPAQGKREATGTEESVDDFIKREHVAHDAMWIDFAGKLQSRALAAEQKLKECEEMLTGARDVAASRAQHSMELEADLTMVRAQLQQATAGKEERG